MHDAGYMRVPVKGGDGEVFALVDAADYEKVAEHRWFLTDGYARRAATRKIRGRQRSYLMHREILGLVHGDHRQTDHVNHDRLDNRRSNLRITTGAENSRNAGLRSGTSVYRGVSWYKRSGVWRAQATFAGVKHYLGSYAVEADAARAVNAFWAERGYSAPNDLTNECASPWCLRVRPEAEPCEVA